MNDKIFHYSTNNTSTPNLKQSPNLFRTTAINLRQTVTPLIIKHNPRKASSKLINKKSAKNLMPKYLYNPPYALEKEKLLFDIEKENIKLRHQHARKKILEKKLQKQLLTNEKKTQSLQKSNKIQSQPIQGIERTITSSLQKPFILQPNQNNIKSINNQIQLITSEIQKNEAAILKIKQSKKYTRYMENEEEKNTFLSELKNMKKYKKKLRMEINKLKRIHQEKKNLRIQELIMEGEIQNTVEMENIQIYQNILEVKQNIRETAFKKATLMKKRNVLLNEIEQLKERFGINDDIILAYFKPPTGNLSRMNYLDGYSRSYNSTQYRPYTSHLNDLGSLKEEDYEEDDSMENLSYQKVIGYASKNQPSKDLIRQNAIQTVKVHSEINSDDGEFTGLQKINELQKSSISKDERKAMEKLEQKYFYEDQNFESQEEFSNKEYDSEQYDEDQGFESEEDLEDHEIQQADQPNQKKIVGVKETKIIEKSPKENQWNNRPTRGLSV